MSTIQYLPGALCALVNDPQARIPLSHTRALQLIASLEGAKDWFSICRDPNAGLLKDRARVLKEEVNIRATSGPLTLENAGAILAKVMQVQPRAKPATPSEPSRAHEEEAQPDFIWPQEGERRLRIGDTTATVYDNYIEFGEARVLRLADKVAICAPPSAKPTKKNVTAWMQVMEGLMEVVMKAGVVVLLGDPGAVDDYSPFKLPASGAGRYEAAKKLLSSYLRYCGSVRSDMAMKYAFLTAAIENLPDDMAKTAMAEYLAAFNEFEEDTASLGRQLNFKINPENRDAAEKLARLAEKHGLVAESEKLAEYGKPDPAMEAIIERVRKRQTSGGPA